MTVNLGEFASYSAPQQRALPLKNCTTGTVLHVSLAHSFILSKCLCWISPHLQLDMIRSHSQIYSCSSVHTYIKCGCYVYLIINLYTLTLNLQVNVTCLTARTTERCNLVLLYYSSFDACQRSCKACVKRDFKFEASL